MNIDRLSGLLEEAAARGITRLGAGATHPTWLQGTEYERGLSIVVTAPEDIKQRLEEFILGEPTLDLFNSKMFNTGFGCTRVEANTLMRWLLYSTSENGVEKTISTLTSFLAAKGTPGLEVLAISGIEVEQPIELSGGIRLIPFSALPTSHVKFTLAPPALNSRELEQVGILPPMFRYRRSGIEPTSALVRDTEIYPKAQRPEDQYAYPQMTDDLREACECLTLVFGCTPLPNAHWMEVASWVPCAGWLGSGWSDPIHDVINPTTCKLSVEQGKEALAVHTSFMRLPRDVRKKLRVPIQRLNQARRRQQSADKAIDLGIAMEALLLGDQESRDQLALAFRLRGAWYLGTDKADRERLVSLFSAIYACRSGAVHTGALGAHIEVPRRGKAEAASFLKEADELCTRTIRKIIDAGTFPDWHKLVLGGL